MSHSLLTHSGQARAILSSLDDHWKVDPLKVNRDELVGLRWRPPMSEWIKVNVDGVVTNYGEQAGVWRCSK